MINNLKALLYKDFLLVLKDKAGLGYLFIMPVFLVFIMTLLQKNSYNSLHNSNIPVVVLNNDPQSLGDSIVWHLAHSGIFRVHEIRDDHATSSSVKEMVVEGKYKIGIIIPDSLTCQIRHIADQKVQMFFGESENSALGDTLKEIRIYLDPVIQNSYVLGIKTVLSRLLSRYQVQYFFNSLREKLPFESPEISFHPQLPVREEYASRKNVSLTPNVVQHNVPAWMLFAMFFIVLSLAGNIVQEREEGSFTRLRIMSVSFSLYILSKVIIYLLVCFIQFILMLLLGIYVLPLVDLPALWIGDHLFALCVIALMSSLSAIGFGIFISSITNTYQQAATLGSLSVVILSAIGGIWIPDFIMPPVMRTISHFSPLNWGIEGFYNILVRNLPLADSSPEIIKLFLFFLSCMVISTLIYNIRKKSDAFLY